MPLLEHGSLRAFFPFLMLRRACLALLSMSFWLCRTRLELVVRDSSGDMSCEVINPADKALVLAGIVNEGLENN